MEYTLLLFSFIFISTKKGVAVKTGIRAVLTVLFAVLFLYPSSVHAQFKDDFLYQFKSRWGDVAVSSAQRVFVVNDVYSRIEEYNYPGFVLQKIHGGFGTGSLQFKQPQGLAIDSANHLYVLDTGNSRVVVLDASGVAGATLTVISSWGTSGASAGQFNNPTGITTSTADGTTYVYVADTGNNRIQRCNSDGSNCVAWGTLGIATGTYSSPKGIAYDGVSGDLLVADTGNNRVQQISSTSGTFVRTFGSYGSSEAQFILPYRIAVSSSPNYIFVLDSQKKIQRIAPSDTTHSSTISLTTSGGGITVNGTVLFATSFPTICETYSISTIALLNSVPPANTNNDAARPVDMALDKDGKIYLINNFPNSVGGVPVVERFDPTTFVQDAEWTGGGTGFGQSGSGPMGIGINTGNDFMVADTNSNLIQKFKYNVNNATTSWESMITPLPTPGSFNSPKDVAIENTGNYYVADTGNGRIVKFQPDGTFVWSQLLPTVAPAVPTPFGGTPPAPYGITLDSSNNVYVADSGYHRILRYSANISPTPGFQTSWGEYGSADGGTIPQLAAPQGMAIDTSGNIYVADTGHNRIQRFDQNGGSKIMWGSQGTQVGAFDQPRNVAVDSQSRVYVSEVGNKRIQVFGDAAASAGLTIVNSNGITVSEGTNATSTGIDSYTVKLNTQPNPPAGYSSTVTVNITVSDSTKAYVTTPVLTFNQDNWNIPQTVTVVPIHDFIANGTHTVTISHKTVSYDTNYNSPLVSLNDVTVTINDTIDIPGVVFSSNTVPSITEGTKLTNAYSIKLNTKPTANVVVTLSPDATMTVDQTTYTFTPENFSTAQQVNITPVHDYVVYSAGTYLGAIHHSTSTSSDPVYAASTITFQDAVGVINSTGNVIATITDIDTAGITVSPTTPLSVNETGTGSTATYTVVLKSKPTYEVQITPTDSSGLVTVSPSVLSFLPTDWNTPQTVTVTAVHDFLKNTTSPRTATIAHTSVSSDGLYNNLSGSGVIPNVSVSVTDTDTTGLLIYRPGGGSVQVTEGGATDTYAFQLTSIPAYNVGVAITSEDGQATTAASLYMFTPANWNTPQFATISAVDNLVSDGTHYGVFLHTLTSADTNFNGKTAYQTATITDNDIPGITVTQTYGAINIVENGPSDFYTVRLNSQPVSPVTLVFSAQNQATASPANLVFTTGNWNTDQDITITAIRDLIVEGPHTATVTYTSASADPKYAGQTASFTANIADDDSISAGVSVVEVNGGTYVKKSTDTTDTYTLALTSKPTANVKITLSTDNTYITTSSNVYWFTQNTWDAPQTVTVSAKTTPVGSDRAITIRHILTSLDTHYSSISAPTVTVTVAGDGTSTSSSSSSSSSSTASNTCKSTAPSSVPHLFQINTTQTEATLYFTPVETNISYYFIAYGYSQGDWRFGTSYEQGPYTGVLNHTVSMLAPATTYYFQIRGGNGCATGEWSNALAATTVGPERSAQATNVSYAPSSASTTSSSSGSSSGYTFTRDLYPGSSGADVKALQQYLNNKGFVLASSGAGSPGNETIYYGNLTAAAVRRFQEAHFTEILNPLGYASGTGIFGPSTRSYVNSHP